MRDRFGILDGRLRRVEAILVPVVGKGPVAKLGLIWCCPQREFGTVGELEGASSFLKIGHSSSHGGTPVHQS